MRFGGVITVILLAVTAWAQAPPTPGSTELAKCPPLSHAELPLYPPIARLAHIDGTVEIVVEANKGLVVDAEVKSIEISSHNSPHLE